MGRLREFMEEIKMKASLIRKPDSLELIPTYDIDIIATVKLEDSTFDYFIAHPLEDYEFLKPYKDTSYKDDKEAHCIAVYPETIRGYFILVCTEGYDYARYSVAVPVLGGQDE